MSFQKTFEQKGTFVAWHAACQWLRDNGYHWCESCDAYMTDKEPMP